MSKASWQWWKPGMTWAAAERCGLLALPDDSQDGSLPADGPPLRSCNVFGTAAIGRAAAVDNPTRFLRAMTGYLPLTIIEPTEGSKRRVIATHAVACEHAGRLYRCARRIAHKGRPRRKLAVILAELRDAIDGMPAHKRGNPRAEQAALDKIERRYLKR